MEVKAFEKIVEYYHENKMSHVYLLVTNNVDKCYEDVLNLAKKIFCENKYEDNCNKCNICNLINQNSLPSLFVISPDGNTIKKEQVLALKKAFSFKPIYTKENIYIIKNVEKLNSTSANTMLKFIEEPDENIIGFLITNDVNNVIDTIKSRCELINVKYNDNNLVNEIINDNDNEYIKVAHEYLTKLEVEKTDLIMYNKDVLLKNYTERNDIKYIFEIIYEVYKLMLKNDLGEITEINKWAFLSKLTVNEIIKRLNLINNILDALNSNANIELLLDYFVVELSELYE